MGGGMIFMGSPPGPTPSPRGRQAAATPPQTNAQKYFWSPLLCALFLLYQTLRFHGFLKIRNLESVCTLSRKQGKHHENYFS